MNELKHSAEMHYYCFSCTEESHRASAWVYLAKWTEEVRVSNILPRKTGQLSINQYNAILEEFAERFLRPAAAKTGVSVELSDAEADLENWMTRATADKLRRFSRAANKYPGAIHPADRDAWKEFLIAAHQEDSKLEPTMLSRWFTEVEDWPEESADKLVEEYQHARELLAFFNTRRSA